MRKYNELAFRILTLDEKELTRTFKKDEEFKNSFDYDKFLYGDNASFRIEEDSLIYNHSSVQPKFREQIEQSINEMRKLDLSSINKIIIDLRSNITEDILKPYIFKPDIYVDTTYEDFIIGKDSTLECAKNLDLLINKRI